MKARQPRLLLATVGVGAVLIGVFAFMVVRFQRELHAEVRRTVLGRDAAVLQPVARQQIVAAEPRGGAGLRTDDLLSAVLQSAQQDGMLAVAVFDDQGTLVRSLPASLLFAELAVPDYVALLGGGAISRFHPDFPLDRYFAGANPGSTAPVLEVLLPLEGRTAGRKLGFAQYYVDGRALNLELEAIGQRIRRQTIATVLIGSGSFALVLAAAYVGMARAQRLLAERNDRLARANFELSLAAKTSALGQITSHLIHGLQGSVAGLRAAVSARQTDGADWETAARHAESMQSLISEIVGLLGDNRAGVTYELGGEDLAAIIRERNAAAARQSNVTLTVEQSITGTVDSHRGGLLCLMAANLVQNAIKAMPASGGVSVKLRSTRDVIFLVVADEGEGIPESVQARLFEPGATGRPDGTGLGLTISRLLARQIGGDLELLSTGPDGTVFRATLPRN